MIEIHKNGRSPMIDITEHTKYNAQKQNIRTRCVVCDCEFSYQKEDTKYEKLTKFHYITIYCPYCGIKLQVAKYDVENKVFEYKTQAY